MKIGIVDYELNNINSVKNALDRLDCENLVIKKLKDFKLVDAIILPGVGSYGEAISKLNNSKMSEKIYNEVIIKKKPFLGICLGMQLMSTNGYEGGFFKGLNLIKGDVKKINVKKKLKLPHVGWNNIKIIKENPLFEDIKNNSCFYFVHSYSYNCNKSNITSTTDYSTSVISSIQKKKIFGVQFHPERSQKNGEILISNFIKFCNKSHA